MAFAELLLYTQLCSSHSGKEIKSRKHIRDFSRDQDPTDKIYRGSNHTKTLRNQGQSGIRDCRVSQEEPWPDGQDMALAVREPGV